MKDSKDDALNDFKIAWKMGLGHSGKLFEGKNPISKKKQKLLPNILGKQRRCQNKM